MSCPGRSPPSARCPRDPAARLDWQKKASAIGAWRELSGYHHPADPIGPEPAAAAPDLRAAWHEALAALGPADGPDVRGMPDGRLLHLRDTYPIETAWAPQYVGDELRQVRAAAWNARLAALRATAEAKAAASRGQHDTAARQQELASSYHALHEACRQRETIFAAAWPTGPTGMPPPAPSATWPWPPTPNCAAATLASTTRRCARPNPSPPPRPSATSSPSPSGSRPRRLGQWIKDLAAAHRSVRGHARRTAEPDRPVRGSRLRGPGPGVPALARTGQGRHLAAAQTRDPPVPAGPPARRGPRRRPGGRRLTVARCILGPGR